MILASQSPRRIQLMNEAGFDVTVCPASIDETPMPGETPLALVERLSSAKAHAVRDAHPSYRAETILAADTIVTLDGKLLGKPKDQLDAARMLSNLSGRTHQVATGVSMLSGTREEKFVSVTDVEFYPLTDAQIKDYIATGEPLDKAGAYGIQGMGRLFVRRISGDYYNVVGLPIAEVYRRITNM